MKKKITSKQLFRVMVIAMIAVLIILGGTYAWIRIGLSGAKTNIIKAGSLDLRIDESPTDGDEIRLERAIPQSYRQGLTNKPYKFTLINNSTIDTDYTISLEDYYVGDDASLTADDKISDSLIRYILVKNDDELIATNSKILEGNRTIDVGTISGKTGSEAVEIPYTLYVWIDSRAGDNGTESDIMDKIFNARLNITAEQHHETTTPTLERDIWTINNNTLCIATLDGDKCFAASDSYETTRQNLETTFGAGACSESTLGAATNIMYNCNPHYTTGDSYDYTSCYIQMISGKKTINCILPYEYNYNNMKGTLTCTVNSDETVVYSNETSSGSCSFVDVATNKSYYFNKNQ